MKAEVLHLLQMLGFEAREPKQARQVMYYPFHFEAPATTSTGEARLDI